MTGRAFLRMMLCYFALCAGTTGSASGREKKAKSSAPRVGVLFLAPIPPVDPSIMKGFRKEIFTVGAGQKAVTLVPEAEITRALRKDPRRFLRKCGQQLSCLLTVIRKANLDDLLLGRWVNPEQPTLQFALINGSQKKLISKGAVNITSPADAAEAARMNFAKMFGIEDDSALPPISEAAAATPAATPPKQPAQAPATAITAPEAVAMDAVDRPLDPWFISGLATLGVGVGLAATGGYFAYHGHQLAQSITYGATGTPQPQVVSTLNQANSAVSTGNVLLIAGAGVGVVGAAVLVLHELDIVGAPDVPDSTATPAGQGHAMIMPLPGGLDVSYAWSF